MAEKQNGWWNWYQYVEDERDECGDEWNRHKNVKACKKYDTTFYIAKLHYNNAKQLFTWQLTKTRRDNNPLLILLLKGQIVTTAFLSLSSKKCDSGGRGCQTLCKLNNPLPLGIKFF